MMSKRAAFHGTLYLVLAIAISACTAIVAAPAQSQIKLQPSQRGIDPSSPLASSVLLQYCSTSGCELRLLDTESGVAPAGFETLDLGRYATFGPSNDLKQLALITFDNSSSLQDGKLQFVDLATWRTTPTDLVFDGAYQLPLFTPDNTRLIVVTQEEVFPASDVVHLVDVAKGELIAEQPLDFYPVDFKITPDGSGIMFYGTKGDVATSTQSNTRVALLDLASLEVVWEAPVDGLVNGQMMKEGSNDPMDGIWWQPTTVFAPKQAMLYIVHADQDQLTTVDFSTQSINTSAITEKLSWIEQLLMLTARTAHAKMANGVSKQGVLSPDGSQLYVVGTRYSIENDTEFVQTGLGLQVIDLATGQEVAHIDSEAQSISVDPSSGRLFLHGWGQEELMGRPYTGEWTKVVDAISYDLIRLMDQRAVAVAHRLDGKAVLLSTTTLEDGKTELTVMDPETFEVLSTSAERYSGYVGWVVLR